MPEFDFSAERLRSKIELSLEGLLPCGPQACGSRLNDAIRYALFPGGKRMRPVLSLLGAMAAGVSAEEALPAACAVEFLHTSSLIFDDLPAMDDAARRRNRPTLHLEFGEDVALLAALALFNQAYAVFASTPGLAAMAAECIGLNGMIGGQAADVAGRRAGEIAPVPSRNQKTSALMRLTLSCGAMAGGADANDVAGLARCGELLGEAYQIFDDLLDESAPEEQTGKTAHQDERHCRASNVTNYGTEAAWSRIDELLGQARVIAESRFCSNRPSQVLLQSIEAIIGKKCRRLALV